jgi:hypothetical protein
MKGRGVRRVLCLVTLCVLAVLMVASVASAQGVYDKDLPPPPPDSDPGLTPGVGEPPKGGLPKEGPPKGGLPKEGPPKGGPPEEEPPGDAKELLKAGGDLPSPQRSATPPEADNGGRFPLWRVAGMVLSAGILVFSLYRLISR